MDKIRFTLIGSLFFIAGCVTTAPQPKVPVKPPETASQQMDAARKVVGGMVAGGGKAPAVKYSPSTGKHYSGELDSDPDTGEKLLPLPE